MPNRIDTPVSGRRDRGQAGGEAPLRVDIVIDTVCPWCYLGLQRFARAIAERPALRAEIRWRAFQINRNAPAAGRDRASDLAARFGSPERAKRHLAALQRTGEREGIAFRFDLIGRTPKHAGLAPPDFLRGRFRTRGDNGGQAVPRLFRRRSGYRRPGNARRAGRGNRARLRGRAALSGGRRGSAAAHRRGPTGCGRSG